MKLRPPVLSLAIAAMVIAACSTPAEQKPAKYEQSLSQDSARVAPPPVAVQEIDQEDAPAQQADLQGAVELQRMQGAAQAGMREKKAFAPAGLGMPYCCAAALPESRENYAHLEGNPVQRAAENPVSTFSIDVDTGSYSNVRRFLQQGQLPPQDAVRVEELVNYFDYAYAPPRERGTPFSVLTELAPAPWNSKTHLLHIGIQGWKPQGAPKPSNLVFLLDVSGSMQSPDKLPLVKSSLKLLSRSLSRQDRISLVVYAGSSGVVLEPTPGNQTAKIEAALDRLEAGGSTNGGDGIRAAYAMARQGWIAGGNNRVLLATDGDFNVGTTGFEELKDLVERERKSGVALTTLGFGQGNLNDHLMEQLADAGNGQYAYIDRLSEAHKVLVEQRDATLTTIARDVKIQIEFNPAVVAEYRLIGYENRLLKREDFSNDAIDAGDIGAGHTVTALYELALTGSGGERMEALRYSNETSSAKSGKEIAFLRLRYKMPEAGMDAASQLIERPITRNQIAATVSAASKPFQLAAAVAGFGQLLRGGQYTGSFRYTDVEALARSAKGEDAQGYTGEFLQLVRLADSLSHTQARQTETPGED